MVKKGSKTKSPSKNLNSKTKTEDEQKKAEGSSPQLMDSKCICEICTCGYVKLHFLLVNEICMFDQQLICRFL